jgi:hypothetical protein
MKDSTFNWALLAVIVTAAGFWGIVAWRASHQWLPLLFK